MVPSSEVWYPFARLQYKQHVWKRGEGNERQNPSTIVFSTLWASLQQFIYVWLKALIKCGNDLAVLQVNVFLWILNHSTKAHQRCVATWGDGRRLQQLPSLATFLYDSLGGMFFFYGSVCSTIVYQLSPIKEENFIMSAQLYEIDIGYTAQLSISLSSSLMGIQYSAVCLPQRYTCTAAEKKHLVCNVVHTPGARSNLNNNLRQSKIVFQW